MPPKLFFFGAVAASLGIITLVFLAASPVHAGKSNGPSYSPLDDEEEEADHPGEAVRWRRLAWLDENGNLDQSARQRALDQRAANIEHWASIDNAGIRRTAWTERGPSNIGGRTRSISINPSNPNDILAGAVGGGVWRSFNAGVTWSPISDYMGSIAIGCLTREPGNPSVVYAGTGEGYYNGDAILGSGIFKSTDGGATFSRLPSTQSFYYVNRIAVQPGAPQTLLAAVDARGVLRSTNGGASWTTVAAGPSCTQILFDPNNPNNAVAALFDGTNFRVIRSLNGGATWQNATAGPTTLSGFEGRVELCYASNVANVVFACTPANGGTVWQSNDGGNNWTVRPSSGLAEVDWYTNSIWVDPTNPNFILVGSVNMYSSTDAGASFALIGVGYINTMQPHPDVHGIFSDPGYNGTSNKKVYVATDGGIYFAPDISLANTGTGWIRRDINYRTTQFYGAAGDGPSGRITGGTQDNGQLTLAIGNPVARMTFGGDGGFVAMDPANPNVIYGEYVYGQVWRSDDGGFTANYIYNSGLTEAGTGSFNFIAPMALDPSVHNRLYVGGGSLWRAANSDVSPVSWARVKTSVGSPISAIAISPHNPDVIWIGHNDGRVYATINGTTASPTWFAIDNNTSPNPIANRYITRIVFDHTNPTKVYIALGGFSSGNVVVTGNSGSTFTSASGASPASLPQAPVRGLCQHPTIASYLYAATEVGVFASDDGGATWSTSNDGPADTSSDEINFMHGSSTLLLATHGRGLWTGQLLSPLVTDAGPGCPGVRGTPALKSTEPVIYPPNTTTVVLSCGNLPLLSWALLAVGYSNQVWGANYLPYDLAPHGMPGCYLRTSPAFTLLTSSLVGSCAWNIQLPPNPSLIGTNYYAQVFAVDATANPGGYSVSNALHCIIGP